MSLVAFGSRAREQNTPRAGALLDEVAVVCRRSSHQRAETALTQQRRQASQPIAWFWDLYRRELLELDPPYQRRSVWNQQYKDYFIDTILLNYPVPAIFLFEDISEDGIGKYAVVDGKQRLTAVVAFLKGEFPVSDSASMNRLQGKYFSDLPADIKRSVYSYQFSIEFLPSTDESTLNNIFDRINRNVAKLTPQELRHAKYSGVFATSADKLAEQLQELLPVVSHASRPPPNDR
ncbi:DUF262 domain-containing protein [Micromonospora sp. M12]